MFEDSSDQVEAPSDKDVDLCCVPQQSSFGRDAGFHRCHGLGGLCQHRVPALGRPLEGAEDAGEHQGVGLLLGPQRRALLDQKLRASAGVKLPAPLVVQTARQHVFHRHVEVLLVWRRESSSYSASASAMEGLGREGGPGPGLTGAAGGHSFSDVWAEHSKVKMTRLKTQRMAIILENINPIHRINYCSPTKEKLHRNK